MYYPFGDPEMVGVEATLTQDPTTFQYLVEFKCTVNKLGDVHRFIDDGDCFSHVASPADDRQVPILPSREERGWGRTDHIRFVFGNAQQAEEAFIGVLRSLDEYVSSSMALDDTQLEPTETIEFR